MPMISTPSSASELREHLLAVGHLRHRLRGDKAHRVDVPKAGGDKPRRYSTFVPSECDAENPARRRADIR